MNKQIKNYLKKLIKLQAKISGLYSKLEKSQHFSHSELENLQNNELQKLINHCYKNVPYYTELFDKFGLKPSDIQTKEDLKKLPYLDKYIVKANFDKLQAKNYPRFLKYKTHTSGTTGTPGEIVWSQKSLNYEYAINERFYKNSNFKNPKKLIMRGNLIKSIEDKTPPFWKFNNLENELILSSYHFNSETAPLYIEKIKQYNPQVLLAYPSTAYLLAKYFETEPIKLNAIFTSSETLTNDKRKKIEEVFSCKIYDWYGQVERVAAIGQCKCGNYHIQEDYSIVEFSQNDSGTEIVGTHLYNYAMPLLRYKTTDTVELSNEKCPCGSNFRIIKKIFGKNSDYYKFVGNNGVQITSLAYIPMEVENIIETQFVQEKVNELIINVTTNGKFEEKDKNKLIENAKTRISQDIDVIVNEVKEIPRGKNGKFQQVINKLLD